LHTCARESSADARTDPRHSNALSSTWPPPPAVPRAPITDKLVADNSYHRGFCSDSVVQDRRVTIGDPPRRVECVLVDTEFTSTRFLWTEVKAIADPAIGTRIITTSSATSSN